MSSDMYLCVTVQIIPDFYKDRIGFILKEKQPKFFKFRKTPYFKSFLICL